MEHNEKFNPRKVPLAVEIYEAAKRWHTTPWEIKKMPRTEFIWMLEMETIEAEEREG